AEHRANRDGEAEARRAAIERGGAVGEKVAVLGELDPGSDDGGERRQRVRRYEMQPRHQFPAEREQQKRRVAEEGAHGLAPCALIASSRTRFQISSTFSMKAGSLKMLAAFLSNLVSTIVLMRPGRADI